MPAPRAAVAPPFPFYEFFLLMFFHGNSFRVPLLKLREGAFSIVLGNGKPLFDFSELVGRSLMPPLAYGRRDVRANAGRQKRFINFPINSLNYKDLRILINGFSFSFTFHLLLLCAVMLCS